MTTLHAQPFNLDAVGFYFDDLDDYNTKAENLMDRHGCSVEEFEIQFIDGRLGGDMAEFEFGGSTYTVTNASRL